MGYYRQMGEKYRESVNRLYYKGVAMKSIDDIVLIMYARLNSERVPNKMTRVFAQTTLIDIAIKKTLALKTIPKENIYLFVHEQELIDIGKKHGINILERSELSANTEDCLKGVHEWYNKLNYKVLNNI